MSLDNVVLVTIDCFRYDRCGFNGYSRRTTPTLSRLSKQSLIYDRCFASGPYTPESFPGILAARSGRNSPYLEDRANTCLPTDSSTLASNLSEQGYDTVAVISNPQLTIKRGFDAGFDYFENLRTGDIADSNNPDAGRRDTQDLKEEDDKNTRIIDPMSIFLKLKNNESMIKPLTIPAYITYRYLQSRGDWPTVDGNEVVDRFSTVIENRVETDSASKGIFGWVHLNDLHAPLHPTRARSTPIAPMGSLYQYLKWDSYRALQRDRGQYPRVYDSTLRYVDEQIRLLINELQRIGVWDQTALIITGDHGEAFCERGVWAHPQHYMYDEVLHVPFLVRMPSGDSDRTAAPLSLVWVHEIVSDLFGTDRFDLPSSSGLSNHADEIKDRVVLSDSITRHGHTVAVRNQEYKYIVHYGSEEYSAPSRALGGLNTEEGYRISGDRGEHDPIDIEEVPESLRKRAQKIRTSPEELVAINKGSTFSDERRRQLQNLGYID